jgi:hypothetical protein
VDKHSSLFGGSVGDGKENLLPSAPDLQRRRQEFPIRRSASLSAVHTGKRGSGQQEMWNQVSTCTNQFRSAPFSIEKYFVPCYKMSYLNDSFYQFFYSSVISFFDQYYG